MRRKKQAERKPGVRIDSGKRTNLALARQRREAAKSVPAPSGPIEDTRVVDVWNREECRTAVRIRVNAEDRRIRRISEQGGGYEGAEVHAVELRGTPGQSRKFSMRCKTGSFEWQYGRNQQGPLFQAGSHLAQIWERAGFAIASPANFLRGISSGYATGLSDSRIAAIEKLDGFRQAVGQGSAERLIDYCVVGMTSTEIALKHGIAPRATAPILHQDLRDCYEFLYGRKTERNGS